MRRSNPDAVFCVARLWMVNSWSAVAFWYGESMRIAFEPFFEG